MTSDNPRLLLIEINEINFDYIKKYIAKGKLPNFAKLIDRHGVVETTSENDYEHLEPWIQWVTAHTGLTFAEHNIFRLGDITKQEVSQIWEFLENKGLSVGAISPMNAVNRLKNACFFVPDPWTDTSPTGSTLLRKLSESVSQAVNDNAKSTISAQSIMWLIAGGVRYARIVNYKAYLSLVIATLKKNSWAKAQFLDLLLSDMLVCETRSTKPQFASLFLNAGAHIQHHYLFNSSVYDGDQHNPEWLLKPSQDPVLDIYEQYDQTLAQIMAAFPHTRLMIATGLHQDAFKEEKYYWRLKDHGLFLKTLGINHESVEPLMSRDFIVKFKSEDDAEKAQKVLELATIEDGVETFYVDNRGRELFVMLTYPKNITDNTRLNINGTVKENFEDDVVFVAIKNGEHNGIGYFMDTGVVQEKVENFNLAELPVKVSDVFGHRWPTRRKTSFEVTS